MGQPPFGADGVELFAAFLRMPDQAKPVAGHRLVGHHSRHRHEPQAVNRRHVGQGRVLKLRHQTRPNTLGMKPLLQRATQSIVRRRQQGGRAFQRTGETLSQFPGQGGHGAEGDAAFTQQVIESGDRTGSRLVRQDHVQTTGCQLSQQIRALPLAADSVHGFRKVEDRFDDLVSDEFGQGISDANLNAERPGAELLLHPFEQFLAQGENLFRVAQDMLARFGQDQPAAAPAKEFLFQGRFEGLDLSAHGGLGDVLFFRSFLQAAFSGYLSEVAQVMVIEKSHAFHPIRSCRTLQSKSNICRNQDRGPPCSGMTEIVLTGFQLASVVFLVLLNGFFVAAEFAIVKIRDTQLEPLVAQGHRRARVARGIVHNLDAALSATQLGITLASLGLGWVGKPVFASVLAPVISYFNVGPAQADWMAFMVGFTIITFLHIVAGELAPKSLAIQKPLPTSLWVALPLQWFYNVFFPVIWLLNHAAFWLLRRCGLEPVSEAELAHSEEEIRLILAQSRRFARGPTLGQDIALNAFALRQRAVREIMRPRHEIIALDADASMAECLAVAEQTRYSRFPLCEKGDLDQTLGVVHSKDIVAFRSRAKVGRDLTSVARKILFVPETAPLEKLLGLFLERKLHLALVVDEYGSTVGLATLENVLEELVGPIEDEFDQEEPLIRRVNDVVWELNGSLPVFKLAQLIRVPLEHPSHASTVSGLMMQHLGRFPQVGDVLALDGWELRVLEIAGTRVTRIQLQRGPGPGWTPAGTSNSAEPNSPCGNSY